MGYSSKTQFILLVYIFLSCQLLSAFGQITQKKQLTDKDFHLWGDLEAKEISADGNWASYSVSYESGQDTLYIQSLKNKTTYIFPKSLSGKFLSNNRFVCMIAGDIMQMVDMNSGKRTEFVGIQELVYANTQNIFLSRKARDGYSTIEIRSLDGRLIDSVANVTTYKKSPVGNALAFVTSSTDQNSVSLLYFDKDLTRLPIIQRKSRIFHNLKWHPKGTSLAFVARDSSAQFPNADEILFFKVASLTLHNYNTKNSSNWPKGLNLNASYVNNLRISNDEKSLFFSSKYERYPPVPLQKSDVQVWNALDKDLFHVRKFKDEGTEFKSTMWIPKTDQIVFIGDSIHPQNIIGNLRGYALVYNPDENKPTFHDRGADINYYIVNLETGIKKFLMLGRPHSVGSLFVSPSGKFITYFKDSHWWIYSLESGEHKNLTKDLPVSFADSTRQFPGPTFPFEYVGWTENDETLLLYDEYDIWKYDAKKASIIRITRGREKSEVYRFSNLNPVYDRGDITQRWVISLQESLLLKVSSVNNSYTGYSIFKNNKVDKILYQPNLVTSFIKARDTETYLYLEEDFNVPKKLMIKYDEQPSKVLFESNKHHYNYAWGHSKLISYINAKGVALQGVLFYPASYDTTKTYPMIVNIYEKQTSLLHKYAKPKVLNGSAINIANYTSQGYFVLLPDIEFEIGNPGFSALDCTVSAVNEALKEGRINKDRIGLKGTSQGSYETNFIITQTNLFRVAVSGAGPVDLVSSYLDLRETQSVSNGWRFENYQMRMGKSLFDNYDGYYKNSPINYAPNITTPLLLWTGSDDPENNKAQIMEFYLALRRLKKENIMLVYPNEGHVILRKDHQIDIGNKLQEWFDHYLKDAPRAPWMLAK